MFRIWLPLVFFEAQRQTGNRKPHVIRFVAVGLAVACLLLAQFEAIRMGGTTLVGSGIEMLRGLSLVNYVLVLIAAVGMFAPVMTNERESGTLPLLIVADVPFRPFVLGKWIQFLLPAVLLAVLQVPLLLSAVFFGGVTTDQAISAVLLLVGLLFVSSAIGLLCSTVSKTGLEAVGLTALVLGFIEFGPMASRTLLSWHGAGALNLRSWGEKVVEVIADWSALSTIETLTAVLQVGRPVPIATTFAFQLACGFGALAIAVSLAPMLRLSNAPQDDSQNESRRESVRVHGDAVAWKAFRFQIYGWRGLVWRIMGYIVAAIVTIGVLFWYQVSQANGWQTVLLVLGLLALVDLLALAAQMFGAERRYRTLPTLVMTTNNPGDLYWRKLLGISPAILVASSVFAAAEILRPPSTLLWVEDSWPAVVFTAMSLVLLLQLITLMSLDFPVTSLFVATISLLICWLAAAILAAVWIGLAAMDYTESRWLIAMSYFLGLATLVAHVICLFRIGVTAAR